MAALILKGVKAICFDTFSQVLILRRLESAEGAGRRRDKLGLAALITRDITAGVYSLSRGFCDATEGARILSWLATRFGRGLEQGQKLFFRNFFAHLGYFDHCVKQVLLFVLKLVYSLRA